jgi:putative addiction module killer protein
MIGLQEYFDSAGRSPFARWFAHLPTCPLAHLPTPASLNVRTALARLEGGNTAALKAVGKGVHEVRIDFGPGYRIMSARQAASS